MGEFEIGDIVRSKEFKCLVYKVLRIINKSEFVLSNGKKEDIYRMNQFEYA